MKRKRNKQKRKHPSSGPGSSRKKGKNPAAQMCRTQKMGEGEKDRPRSSPVAKREGGTYKKKRAPVVCVGGGGGGEVAHG